MASAKQIQERKNTTVNFQLHPKKATERLEETPELTAGQMKAIEKTCADLNRYVGNLDCIIFDPGPEQAKHIRGRLDELIAQIKEIRAKLPLFE